MFPHDQTNKGNFGGFIGAPGTFNSNVSLGRTLVHSEMAKYPAEFVSAHKFDMIFARWALPGILMFMLGGVLAVVAIVLWFVERNTVKQKAIVERFRP